MSDREFSFDAPPAKRRFSMSEAPSAASPYFATHDQQQHMQQHAALGMQYLGASSTDSRFGTSMGLLVEEGESDPSDDGTRDDAFESASNLGQPHGQNGHLATSNATATAAAAAGTSTSASDDAKTKKRARATPEQLAILEETFLTHTSPNAKLRETLSSQVNMTERSIQIWFQNRRAKVKLMQKRAAQAHAQENAKRQQNYYVQAAYGGAAGAFQHPQQQFGSPFAPFIQPRPAAMGRSSSVDFSTMGMGMGGMGGMGGFGLNASGPSLDTGLDLAIAMHGGTRQQHQMAIQQPMRPRNHSAPLNSEPMHNKHVMMHGGGWAMSPLPPPAAAAPQTVLTSDALSIGTWRRVRAAADDLIVTLDAEIRSLRYEIADGASRFKIETPLGTLLAVTVEPIDAFRVQLAFDVSTPPLFFMANAGSSNPTTWTQCRDFTESMQGSCVLRHVVRGSAASLSTEWINACRANPQLQIVTRFAQPPNQQHQMHMQLQLQQQQQMAAAAAGVTSGMNLGVSPPAAHLLRPSSPFRRHSTPTLNAAAPFSQSTPSLDTFVEEPTYSVSDDMLSSPELDMDALVQQQQQQQQHQQLHAHNLPYHPHPHPHERQLSAGSILDGISYITLEPGKQQQQQKHQHFQPQQQDQEMVSLDDFAALGSLSGAFLGTGSDSDSTAAAAAATLLAS
ncbi:hypothetical protein HDU87_004947 [Geranomyces variabilis]|uniref:Homeobox domain-containing protein n=1 Tax=Geranomyces variabilis TaxID=109894 RepID=A0AAD5THI3_9FUNG|nr:hypothetical protein HDU87_004947 [Geranomyces variabilis]